DDGLVPPVLAAVDRECQAVVDGADGQLVWAFVAIFERKRVLVEQVIDRDFALVLDIRVAAPDGRGVECDFAQAVAGLDGVGRCLLHAPYPFPESRISTERR